MVPFALGTAFVFGTLYSKHCLQLHIASSLVLLAFVYSRACKRHPGLRLSLASRNELLMLAGGLGLESIAVSTSAGYLRIRAFKLAAACGLSASITGFCLVLDHAVRNKQTEMHRLRTGPYRYARHPAYASLALHWMSCCMYLGCFLSLAAFLLFVGLQISPRISDDERRREGTSPEHAEYRRTVWSGIPMLR